MTQRSHPLYPNWNVLEERDILQDINLDLYMRYRLWNEKLKSKNTINKTEIAKLTKKYGKDLFDFINPYRIEKRIGSGRFGEVFLLYNPKLKRSLDVIKIQKVDSSVEFNNEIIIQNKLAEQGFAPNILNHTLYYHKRTRYGIIHMTKIDMSLKTLLKEPLTSENFTMIKQIIRSLIDFLCKESIVHGDLHYDNITFYWDVSNLKPVLKPMFIDFGWSSYDLKCNPKLEILQLLRSNEIDRINKNNKKEMEKILLSLYSQYTGEKIKKSYDTYDRLYDKEHDKYRPLYKRQLRS